MAYAGLGGTVDRGRAVDAHQPLDSFVGLWSPESADGEAGLHNIAKKKSSAEGCLLFATIIIGPFLYPFKFVVGTGPIGE